MRIPIPMAKSMASNSNVTANAFLVYILRIQIGLR
jgi:hypothetical protein